MVYERNDGGIRVSGFNMGVRQSGERVHHVQLPPWSGDDPRR